MSPRRSTRPLVERRPPGQRSLVLYEADAHGFALAHSLGATLDDALSLLMRQPMTNDSATHPATRRRIAQFRMLQARADDLEAQGGATRTVQVGMPRPH